MNPDSMIFRPSAHKLLVPVAFLAPEIEVAVCDGKAITRITADKDLRHAHGVYAAAYCQKCLSVTHPYLLAIVQVNPNRRDSLN